MIRYISHKSNIIQSIHEIEGECRKAAKGIATDSEYCTWLATITDADGVITYPSETFTIVEVTDENVPARLNQLGDYVNSDRAPGETLVYNIKWSDSKVNCEEVLDIDENSHDPKQYVQSHFKGDDTAKTARLLADEWTLIRTERDRLLTSTDWTQGNDTPLSDANTAKWTTYRGKLRTLPADQSSKTKYSQVTWPTKP